MLKILNQNGFEFVSGCNDVSDMGIAEFNGGLMVLGRPGGNCIGYKCNMIIE
jgi:hypothetical protein